MPSGRISGAKEHVGSWPVFEQADVFIILSANKKSVLFSDGLEKNAIGDIVEL